MGNHDSYSDFFVRLGTDRLPQLPTKLRQASAEVGSLRARRFGECPQEIPGTPLPVSWELDDSCRCRGVDHDKALPVP